MRLPSRILVGCLALLGLGLTARPASAAFTIVGADGDRAASVTFSVSAGQLTMTLTNTYNLNPATEQVNPAHLLTGVFFKTNSTFTLGKVSATLAPGSSFLNGGLITPDDLWDGTDVGGEFAYATGINPGTTTYDHGVSSSGLGAFGTGDRFNTNTLYHPDNPDGPDFGIAPEDTQLADLDGDGATNRPQIKNSVVFKFTTGLTEAQLLATITQVRFQYGTGFADGSIETPFDELSPVPAPAGLVLLASAIPVLGLRRVLRRKTA
jgi:hypothetical protein